MRMSFRYFNLNEYLTALIKEFEPMAKSKNLELVYTPVRQNFQVLGDKTKLRQVFINLITNAIKYTEKGKVEVLVQEDQKAAKITIKDTGIGIPQHDISRIFERFYRVDKARSKAAGGTGLGLAIAKHIVEAHRGRIWADSQWGIGTTIYMAFPKAL
jgi:signal transduction histidine kinase